MKKMILSFRATIMPFFILFSFSSCSKTSVTAPLTTNNPPKEAPPANVVTNTFTYQGFVYHTIDIPTQRGIQTWMVENFRAAKYNDGTDIPHIIASTNWEKNTNGARCYYGSYGNSDSLKSSLCYGAMYNWYAISSANFAPQGWHVPTPEELNTLAASFGGPDLAGGALKDTTKGIWNDYVNGHATNYSGFTGKGGGYRAETGSFHEINTSGYYWTSKSSITNPTYAWSQNLSYANPGTWQTEERKSEAISVRLIKDNSAY